MLVEIGLQSFLWSFGWHWNIQRIRAQLAGKRKFLCNNWLLIANLDWNYSDNFVVSGVKTFLFIGTSKLSWVPVLACSIWNRDSKMCVFFFGQNWFLRNGENLLGAI